LAQVLAQAVFGSGPTCPRPRCHIQRRAVVQRLRRCRHITREAVVARDMPARALMHRRCQSVRWFVMAEGSEPAQANGVTRTVPSQEQPKEQRAVPIDHREDGKRRSWRFGPRMPSLGKALTLDELPSLLKARTPKPDVLPADQRLKAPPRGTPPPLASAPAKLLSAPAWEEHRAAGVLPNATMPAESRAEFQTQFPPCCAPELLPPRSPSATAPSTKLSL